MPAGLAALNFSPVPSPFGASFLSGGAYHDLNSPSPSPPSATKLIQMNGRALRRGQPVVAIGNLLGFDPRAPEGDVGTRRSFRAITVGRPAM